MFVSSLPTLRFVEKESFQDFLPTVTSAQLSEGEAGVENDPSLFRERWCLCSIALLVHGIVR